MMFDHQVSIEKSTNVRVLIFKKLNTILSRLAPGLAAKLAERIFVTPIPIGRPTRENGWAERAERASLPSALSSIPVWVWGEGSETVILVHGWSGRGLQLGAFVEPLVSSGYRVVAYDAPGHGAAHGRTSSMPAFASALGAVARRFGPVSAVIAHSLGATAAIYALAHRELVVDRIVAISPSARLHAVRERFGMMTGFPPKVIDRMRQGFEDRLGFDWEASEPLRLIRQLSMPSLFIHDAGDRFIPHSEAAELASASPDGRLISTTGLGHHRILRDQEIIESTVQFIAGADAVPLVQRRAS
jgi:pimeloyl-ACP methyl ester carboxylesterase